MLDSSCRGFDSSGQWPNPSPAAQPSPATPTSPARWASIRFDWSPSRVCRRAASPTPTYGSPPSRSAACSNGPRRSREVTDFGLRLAETRRLSNLGAVGLVLREQPTLRKALEAMISYSWAQNQALTLKLEVLGDAAILREGTASIAGRQSDEMTLGVLTLTIRRLVGPAWRPREVHLTHSRPADVTAHRRVFGVMPLFDEEFDGLVIERRPRRAHSRRRSGRRRHRSALSRSGSAARARGSHGGGPRPDPGAPADRNLHDRACRGASGREPAHPLPAAGGGRALRASPIC